MRVLIFAVFITLLASFNSFALELPEIVPGSLSVFQGKVACRGYEQGTTLKFLTITEVTWDGSFSYQDKTYYKGDVHINGLVSSQEHKVNAEDRKIDEGLHLPQNCQAYEGQMVKIKIGTEIVSACKFETKSENVKRKSYYAGSAFPVKTVINTSDETCSDLLMEYTLITSKEEIEDTLNLE